jgi:hypothetical protein
MSKPPNNRQMAARFKKLGFVKPDLALSRNALHYKLPGYNALFMFSKSEKGGIACSSPDSEGALRVFSFPLGLTQSKFEDFIKMGVDFSFDESGELSLRQALLDIAAFFVTVVNEEKRLKEHFNSTKSGGA